MERVSTPSDYVIVNASESDCADIAVIDGTTTEARSAADFIDAAGKDCYRLYVIKKTENTDDGEILGFALFTFVCYEAELLKITIKESARGCGLGKILLEAALDNLRKEEAESVFLEVREDNLPAIKLYENCGFNPVGRRKNFYTNPVCDALTFNRSFNPDGVL